MITKDTYFPNLKHFGVECLRNLLFDPGNISGVDRSFLKRHPSIVVLSLEGGCTYSVDELAPSPRTTRTRQRIFGAPSI